jgi:tetratricopeptide (TPR) repeat protein
MTTPAGAVDAGGIRQLLVEYQRSHDPRVLRMAAAAVDRLIDRPGFADLDGGARAFVWTLGAAALTLHARTAEAEPDDLDRAIAWSTNAVDAWPADDPNLARARCNLATALTDRYERDGRPADLDVALRSFGDALTDMRAHGDRLDVILHSYGCCYHERATAPGGDGVADLDRAIALFEEALSQPEPDSDERAGYLNSLGLALRRKGLALADPAVLRSSSEAFTEARSHAVRGSENYLAASVNLAGVLHDRAEADNEVDRLRAVVKIYRDVLELLDSDDERRHVLVTTNLATALIDLYRYTRDRGMLDQATHDLRANAERLPDGQRRQTVQANLAAALHEMFDYTGRLSLLDQAIAVQETVVGSTGTARPERMLNLGVSLLARFRRRRAVGDLDRAIDLFAATARVSASRIERASALNSQANALSLRFDDSRSPADITTSISLREEAVDTIPEGSIEQAMYRANLGVDLLKRYELTADVDDLRRAVDSQRHASDAAGSWSDQPRFLAGLADSLAREAERTGNLDDVAHARETYRRAVDLARISLPEQALGAAMRWGEWESRRHAWREAVEAYGVGMTALRALVADQDLRGDKESWLIDAQGLPAAAGLAGVRAGRPHLSVTLLEDGRAMLLAEALARRTRLRSIRAHDQNPESRLSTAPEASA